MRDYEDPMKEFFRNYERDTERDIKMCISTMLKNRVCKWIDDEWDDDEGDSELNLWADATAERLYADFHGAFKSTYVHMEIEASKLMAKVWGDDKSWQKEFHSEINWRAYFEK